MEKNPPTMQETWLWLMDQKKEPLEKEMATLSIILAWEIQCKEEAGGCSPWGHKRVWHNLATKQQTAAM